MPDSDSARDEVLHGVTLEAIVEKRDFYVFKSKFLFAKRADVPAQIKRLAYGAHLIRCELFRMRARAAGLDSATVERHVPDFVPPEVDTNVESATLAMLHQRVEYLRADLIVAKAAERACRH